MHKISIGADPEIFTKTLDGVNVSAHDLVPGTKEQPHQVACGAIQVDGTALEFNIDPASSVQEFVSNIDLVMAQLEESYKQKRPDLVLAIEPTAFYDKAYFDSLPEEARLLGCSADFNAYTGKTNKKPTTDQPKRTAGGHVHVGWGSFDFTSDAHFDLCIGMVRQLDSLLFLSSMLWDSDQERRTMYGAIGSFRPKPFGVEYRPLSNRWLSKVSIQEFIFEATTKAAQDFLNGVIYEEDPLVAETLWAIHHGDIPSEKEIRQYLRHLNDKFKTPLFV